MAYDVQYRFVDEDGEYATHSYRFDNLASYPAAATGLIAALEGVSNARVDRFGKVNSVSFSAPAAVSNPYDIRDKLVFTFKTISGLVRMSIPAPLEAILTASDFGNKAHPLIEAVADAAIGYVQNQYGEFASQLLTVVRQHVSRGSK